jgi:uncharacterized protein (DUF1684 family)
VTELLDLWDYRRRVADIYSQVRRGGRDELVWRDWISSRDDLFRTHPQTPIDDLAEFVGLPYFEFDTSWRTVARFVSGEPEPWGDFLRIGRLEFEVRGMAGSLGVFWLNAYGGGVFVPFCDATNGQTTYGGGRYLLDTVKGADLGHEAEKVVVDFNYAYHPSCVHSDRWSCPLAPPDSGLSLEVTAGERLGEGR